MKSGGLKRESQAYRVSNRRAIALSAAFVPLIRMIILLGFTGNAALWRDGYGCRKDVGWDLQCVGVPDTALALAFDPFGRNSRSVSTGDGFHNTGDESAGYSHRNALRRHTPLPVTKVRGSWNCGMLPLLTTGALQ
jgi:hypothetical protein